MARYTEKNIDKFLEKVTGTLEDLAVDVGYDLANRIMIQSPVYTGQYKASFRASVNAPDPTAEPPRARDMRQGPGLPGISIGGVGLGGEVPGRGGEETDEMYNQVAIEFDAEDEAIYISNSTPYASAIEYAQLASTTPEGVMRVAFEYFVSNLQSTIAESLQTK